MEVHEEELRTVTAQRMYKMRCECGRSWFELEVPKFVECPASFPPNKSVARLVSAAHLADR